MVRKMIFLAQQWHGVVLIITSFAVGSHPRVFWASLIFQGMFYFYELAKIFFEIYVRLDSGIEFSEYTTAYKMTY